MSIRFLFDWIKKMIYRDYYGYLNRPCYKKIPVHMFGENPEHIKKVDSPADMSKYPDNNPKTSIGVTKPPMHAIPPSALLYLGLAMENGEYKYGLFNWRDKKVSSTVYYDAAFRHLLAWFDGENEASDSKVHHLAHVMACCAIILDAEANGTLNDNRGFKGKCSELIEKFAENRKKDK